MTLNICCPKKLKDQCYSKYGLLTAKVLDRAIVC